MLSRATWREERKRLLFFILGFQFLEIFAASVLFSAQERHRLDKENYLAARIREIYEELRPAASVSPEGLREWQSFLGKDEDDTYKDDHLFIIMQEKEKEVRLWIQITFLERDKINPRKQTALGSKGIEATIDGKTEKVSIRRNEFSSEEVEKIFATILRSIREKKKLLGIKGL